MPAGLEEISEYDPLDPNSVPRPMPPMSIDDLIRLDQESRKSGGLGIPNLPATFASRFQNMDFNKSPNVEDRRQDSTARNYIGALMSQVLKDNPALRRFNPSASAFAGPAQDPNGPYGSRFKSVMGDQLGTHELDMAEHDPARLKELMTLPFQQDDPAADMVFDVIHDEGDT